MFSMWSVLGSSQRADYLDSNHVVPQQRRDVTVEAVFSVWSVPRLYTEISRTGTAVVAGEINNRGMICCTEPGLTEALYILYIHTYIHTYMHTYICT
jgi:hypothetical protein